MPTTKKKLSYRKIFDASCNGIIATDANGRIFLINRQAEKILALDKKTVRGAYISDILPHTGPLVIKCLKSGKPRLTRHVTGKGISLAVDITEIREHDQILGAVCTFQETKESEPAAPRGFNSCRQWNIHLEAIFNSSSDGIWVCDSHGNVISINRASEKLNGIKAKDVMGRNIRNILEEGLLDQSATLEAFEKKKRINVVQNIKKTKKQLLVTGTPVFDEKGNISLVIVNERDMTQLNAVQEELKETKMEAKKIRDELSELMLLEFKNQEIIAENDEMRRVLNVALKLSNIGASDILLLGESGVGKGMLAMFIHKNARLGKKPFVQINCAALPDSLLEAELFGYEKGAFTGAREKGKAGLIELAKGGTLFLDEIGDLPVHLQAKLLKYLDDREVLRLGGVKPQKIDCTIIAATNCNLEQMVREKKFRKDLYYRLNTFTLKIPALRERPEDIFELTTYYLKKYNRKYHVKNRISPKALSMLHAYSFPGNVRELKNIIKNAVVMSEHGQLDELLIRNLSSVEESWKNSGNLEDPAKSLNEALLSLEQKIIKNAMKSCSSTRQLAAKLGISQPTVVRKMKKHGLVPG
ncbi:MAG: Fis family transcriptional regulator [Deltaproteobacteria bacterium]|nr:MAG: Fis family transcriptional regulator [Deltaproteobacteria bacterium]